MICARSTCLVDIIPRAIIRNSRHPSLSLLCHLMQVEKDTTFELIISNGETIVPKLMSSSPDLAAILGRINDGICIFSQDQQVSFVNDKAAQILNAADGEFYKKISEAAQDRLMLRFEH